MRHIAAGAAGCLFIASAVAGGQARPTTASAERYLRQQIDSGRQTRLRLTGFERIDGKAGQFMGTSVYAVMFRANSEFVTNVLYSAGDPFAREGKEIVIAPYREEAKSFSWNDFGDATKGYRRAMTGDQLRLEGEVAFEKRESGWSPIAVVFRYAQDSSGRRRQRR